MIHKIFILWCLGAVAAFGQTTVVVSGTVSDATTGKSIFGVWVKSRATYYATATNPTGYFQVRARPGGVLIISHWDYKTQKIRLKEGQDVVVRLVRKKITPPRGQLLKDSTTQIPPLNADVLNADFLNSGLIVNPLQALTGKLPGLVVARQGSNPDQNPTVLLRGMGSLVAGVAPLYVVDGIPNVPIDQLPVEDIASVEVLRGAAASRYGMRGANGVLLVKTKRAELGGASVEYRSSVGVETIARQYDLLNADEFRTFAKQIKQPFDDNGANTDWVAATTRPAFNINQYLAFGQHTKQFNYRASFSYLKQQGNIKTVDSERIAGRISATQSLLNDRLKIGFNLSLASFYRNKTPESLFNYSVGAARPTDPIFNADGSYFEQFFSFYQANPVGVLENTTHQNRRLDGLGTLYLNYQITPNLNLTAKGTWRGQNDELGYFQGRKTQAQRFLKGEARREYRNQQERYFETELRYSRQLKKHQLEALGGYAFQELTNRGMSARNTNFIADELSFNNLGAGAGINIKGPIFPSEMYGAVGSFRNDARIVSFYGLLNYDFDQKYSVNLNLRYDGSSKFAPGRRWGVFPSVALGWNLGQMNFLNKWTFFQTLKLRTSYGISGNFDGIAPYQSQTLVGPSRDLYFDGGTNAFLPSYGITQLPNPTLQWEQTRSSGLGVDMAFFDKRLRGSIDWYNRRSSGVLWPTIPPFRYVGYDAGQLKLLLNTGIIQNKGIELAIEADVVQRKHFKWQLNLAAARNQNKLISLNENEIKAENSDKVYLLQRYVSSSRGSNTVTTNILRADLPVGAFYGPTVKGVENGYFTYDRTRPWEDIQTFLGSPQPRVTMGVTNRFSYKRWQLTFLLNGRFGSQLFNMNRPVMSPQKVRVPVQNALREALSTPVGDAGSPYMNSYWIENGGFLRLENAALHYEIKTRKTTTKLRAFVAGNNLFLITKYSGVDPEMNVGTLQGGVEYLQFFYKSRGFNAGFQAEF